MKAKSANAYLLQAALALKPEGVNTVEQLRAWIEANAPAIAKKAGELQWELFEKLQKPEVKQAVTRVIGARVWGEVNKREINRRVNMETKAALD